MSKISTENFYYCTLAQVNQIDNTNNRKSIHCNNEFKYTFAYLDLDKNNNYLYYDVTDLKPIKPINSKNINIGDWCIISIIKLDLKDKRYHKEFLRNVLKKVPDILEENINSNYYNQLKKTL